MPEYRATHRTLAETTTGIDPMSAAAYTRRPSTILNTPGATDADCLSVEDLRAAIKLIEEQP